MSNETFEDDRDPTPPPSRWRKVLLYSIIGALVLAAVLARPVYKGMKARRSRDLQAQAEGFLRQRNIRDAYRAAQAAYQLNPTDPQTLRLVARLYTMAGQESALGFWRTLLAMKEAGAPDRQEFIQAALQFGRYEMIEEELGRLLREKPDDLSTLGFASQYYFRIEDRAQALLYCRKALAKDANHAPARLMLVQLLLSNPTPRELEEARSTLKELAKGSDQTSLEALTILARVPDLTNPEQEEVIQAISNHPLARTEQHLLALDLKLRLHPRDRDALLDSTFLAYKGLSQEHQLALARWLNGHAEYGRTANLITSTNVLQNHDLLLARLDAMAAMKQWGDIDKILRQPNALEPVLVELFSARVAREMGDAEKAEMHWKRVHAEAGQNIKALQYVSQYAERLGETAESAKAYRALTKNPATARKAFEALIRFGERSPKTAELRDVLREMTAKFPTDPVPRNDLAYLNLLLNENVAESLKSAEELVAQNPNVLACRITLALGYLRTNEPQKARDVFKDVQVKWPTLLPAWQAVHAAVRGANGDSNLARVLSRPIPPASLKPEERKLIEPWTGG